MNTNMILKVLGAAALLGLTACGSSTPAIPLYPAQTLASGGCAVQAGLIPVGLQKSRTVVANFGVGGATMTLDIYEVGQNRIAAVGEINIPSVEAFLSRTGTNYPGYGYPTNGYNYPGYGYGYGTPGAPAPTPGNTPLRTCLISTGYGQIDSGGGYENLDIALDGGGVHVEMGSNIGVQAFLDETRLQGAIFVKLPQDPNGWTYTAVSN